MVGKERVIASSDCGFRTFIYSANVDTRIVWAKLATMAEGAKIASGQLEDQAEAARRLGVTRARITQLLALVHLAPDPQERVLFLE